MTLEQRITALATEIGLDIKQLLNTPPGSFSITTVEIDLGNVGKDSGDFQITGLSGLPIGNPVLIMQAPAPYTGKGDLADEGEEMVLCNGYVLDASTIQVYWSSVNQSSLNGNIKFMYKIL
jgi:hypothetical protein